MGGLYSRTTNTRTPTRLIRRRLYPFLHQNTETNPNKLLSVQVCNANCAQHAEERNIACPELLTLKEPQTMAQSIIHPRSHSAASRAHELSWGQAPPRSVMVTFSAPVAWPPPLASMAAGGSLPTPAGDGPISKPVASGACARSRGPQTGRQACEN
jgi:hypothetical protein